MKETPDRYQIILQIWGFTCSAFFFPWIIEYNVLCENLRKQTLDNHLKLSFVQPAFKIHSLLWKKATSL